MTHAFLPRLAATPALPSQGPAIGRCFGLANVAACLLLWVAAPAHASVTYAYTGNQMTKWSQDCCELVAGLTLEIQLTGPLPHNFSGDVSAEVWANGWSFAGPELTMTNDDYYYFMADPPSVTLSTDDEGKIVSWDISESSTKLGFAGPVDFETCSQPTPASCRNPNTGLSANAVDSAIAVSMIYHYSNENNPGTWTLIPEPSTAVLLTSGLLGLVMTRRKQP